MPRPSSWTVQVTISVDPHPCKQLYTIRVPFKDVTVTAVYAFLPNKCQDTYRELFQSIVDNYHASNLQLNVQTIITDFEDAVLRAVTAVFGRHINHQGCFYHLTQASCERYNSLVWCLSTTTTTTSDCSVV
jgi:hypothetical protein